jgi:hypothetical protein
MRDESNRWLLSTIVSVLVFFYLIVSKILSIFKTGRDLASPEMLELAAEEILLRNKPHRESEVSYKLCNVYIDW